MRISQSEYCGDVDCDSSSGVFMGEWQSNGGEFGGRGGEDKRTNAPFWQTTITEKCSLTSETYMRPPPMTNCKPFFHLPDVFLSEVAKHRNYLVQYLMLSVFHVYCFQWNIFLQPVRNCGRNLTFTGWARCPLWDKQDLNLQIFSQQRPAYKICLCYFLTLPNIFFGSHTGICTNLQILRGR